ncbi:FtsX-like permease family protein [Kitasatospora sp. HPMI-4]|uniref:FtsX-like permease family protein n=1 Tax=Kitasatospora sp. HPMI-4 TaxID=3448443 RepID=UPI003F1D169E
MNSTAPDPTRGPGPAGGTGATAGRERASARTPIPARSPLRAWAADLLFGARLALSGGRQGWLRTAMTAFGVGLGVALLLAATAIPSALQERHNRDYARLDAGRVAADKPAADTMAVDTVYGKFRGEDISGRLLQPDGPKAPLPPGLTAMPKPGEMVVSPALRKLLEGNELLRERYPQRIIGTIGDAGLAGPSENYFYAGTDRLDPVAGVGYRISSFGDRPPTEAMSPMLVLLVIIGFVVMLLPVAVFVAAAVRFGGESRDRRLAALRLVGSDTRMTRRIAAGEAAFGALIGVLAGAVMFLFGRQLVRYVSLFDLSLFPSDLRPSPLLGALTVLAVPAAAIAVTLLAMRGVVVEPLGVFRQAQAPRRRLWWRLVLPVAGVALLTPLFGGAGARQGFNEYQVAGGAVLILVGVAALLPWLIESVVARLSGGPVAWQLAIRRLQLDSGTSARVVSGIAVAAAGAIALQMLFSGVDGDFERSTGRDLSKAQALVMVPAGQGRILASELDQRLRATPGVTGSNSLLDLTIATGGGAGQPPALMPLAVGSCEVLQNLGEVGDCRDGDAFSLERGDGQSTEASEFKPGQQVEAGYDFDFKMRAARPNWTLPASFRTVAPHEVNPVLGQGSRFLLTPAAAKDLPQLRARITGYVKVDESNPDAYEHLRNSVAAVDPAGTVFLFQSVDVNRRFAAVKRALFAGVTVTLLLIGASMLVGTVEQLRERRRLLAVLIAFGTRRGTLCASVFWQTAVPVALGIALSILTGIGLGAALLSMVDHPVHPDWGTVLGLGAIGAAVVLLVTAASLPSLWRMMRAEGLRTE